MVAERDFNDLKDVVESLRQDKELHDTKIEALEIRLKKLDEWKIDFGDALEAKIANIELEANTAQGHLNAIVIGAKLEFETTNKSLQNLWEQAKLKFDEHNHGFGEMNDKIQQVLTEPQGKFGEMNETLSKGAGGGGSRGKAGFLPDKIMIPKPFNHDVSGWRKWKEEVAKYFDDEHEGMKFIMDR